MGGLLFRWRLAVIVGFFAAAALYAWATLSHRLDVPLRPLGEIVGAHAAFLVCGPLSLVAFWLRAAGEARLGSAVYGQGASARVVTGGPFRLMRHPLYAGTWLFFAATFAPWLPPVVLAVLALAFALCLAAIAAHEERELAAALGDAWTRYAARVGRFGGLGGLFGGVDDDGIRPSAGAWALATLANLGLLSLGAYRILVGTGVMFRGLRFLSLVCLVLWIAVVVVRRAIRR